MLPTFCTYSSEKSRVIIAYSIAANAPTAATALSTAKREMSLVTEASRVRALEMDAMAPNNEPTMPTSSSARPIVPATPLSANTLGFRLHQYVARCRQRTHWSV